MPDGPDQHDGHVEPDAETEHDPEIGGADWLLAQLSGGRRARREVEPEAPNPAPAAAEDEAVIPVWYAAPSATSTEPSEPSEPSEPAVPSAPSAPATPAASAVSEPQPQPEAEPEPESEPASASVAETEAEAEAEAGPETEAEPEPVAPVARAAASSSAVWSLFADFDTDEPAQPAPVESDQDSDPAQAHDADDDASTSSVETEEEAAAAAGFHWGLRAGEDPAKYSSADAAADAAPFLPAPFVAAPFVAPVFGAPAAEPPRFPTPIPPPPVEDEPHPELEPEPEPELEPDDAEPAAASAPEISDPIDFADADTAATALLATAESEQSSFIDTQAANPALSGLVLPPAALVAPPAFAAASDPSDEAANQIPGAANDPGAAYDAQVPTDVDSTSDGTPPGGTPPDGTPPGGKPPVDRRLLWTVGVLGLVVVLVGLFFLGTRLPTMFGAAPTPTPSAAKTPTPTPTPTVAPEVTGPAAAGEHPWDQLGGGECIDPYTGPWAETFTVVDCAAPHAAQLVYRGTFGGDATTAFPGEEALASQINLLCSAPGVIDVNAAGGYPDLQLQGSFPVTEEQWTTTKRYYYCFVSRSGGEPITASVAGPGPAA